MTDKEKIRATMPLSRAMAMYGTSDKERFQCAYEEAQEGRPDSTFYADFSVADVYGEDAIRETFASAFSNWKGDARMFVELVAALNHKIWFWYEAGVEEYSALYDSLWRKADEYGCEHFKGEDANHYFQVLD